MMERSRRSAYRPVFENQDVPKSNQSAFPASCLALVTASLRANRQTLVMQRGGSPVAGGGGEETSWVTEIPSYHVNRFRITGSSD